MQIQPKERDKIALLLASGVSLRLIAKKLSRSVSSISEEVKRNSYSGEYRAIHAQRLSNNRKNNSHHRHPLKNKLVYAYVLEKLKEGWSPEQIDGRLKLKNGHRVISYECIYQFIFNPQNKDKRLWEYLPLKRKRRTKKHGRKSQRIRIPNRVTIHLRPKSVEKRKEFGHWEADSVIGSQTKSKIIHTEVERKTRYLQATIIDSKSSIDTIEAQKKIFAEIPARTVTMDNGAEFAKHEELTKLGIKTFFADPYCSGQRGTNENTNGLLRRYLPKKTSFENIDQGELNDIVFEINNRPRKVLKFQTPREVLELELLIKSDRIRF